MYSCIFLGGKSQVHQFLPLVLAAFGAKRSISVRRARKKSSGIQGFSLSQSEQILTKVMARIVVDKSTDNAKPHSICFLPQYRRQRKSFLSERELKKALCARAALSGLLSTTIRVITGIRFRSNCGNSEKDFACQRNFESSIFLFNHSTLRN